MTNPQNTSTGDARDAFLFEDIENYKFGYVDGLGKIETLVFLDYSKRVVCFVERMGKIFAPLKHDMNGNINKLTKKYLENETSYKYLDDMILDEKKQKKDVATDALMWLRRGLHFLATFFQLIVDDKTQQESLVQFIRTAYEEVLQRYHGWMGVQLFNIMCRFAPKRRELFKIIAPETQNETEIMQNMNIFKTNLLTAINYLINFYEEHELETTTVV
ncbi:glycolipid transfer protein A isoform X2 [Onthophagus taurus]|uniref:glycolipid transfer protein A isoform X2 n=1 Tax=Onthophagus taurus TaxID=166361 RepID=UPI000C201457|nr:glycolipid transfer protein A isoform X1 [Onthophagus taurus]